MYDYKKEFEERRKFELEGRGEGDPLAAYGEKIVDMAEKAYEAVQEVFVESGSSAWSETLAVMLLSHALFSLPLVPKGTEGKRLFLIDGEDAEDVANLLKALQAEREKGEKGHKA